VPRVDAGIDPGGDLLADVQGAVDVDADGDVDVQGAGRDGAAP
jgi:hypothetical protein